MKSTKKLKALKLSSALFLFVILLTGFTPAPLTIEIDVAPTVLNLNNQGEVVTVHTDVAYSLVVTSSVYLNGVLIDHWKADNRGNFVAKFLMEEVKALDLKVGTMNTLTFVGETVAGVEIIGNQDIKVINVEPAGKR